MTIKPKRKYLSVPQKALVVKRQKGKCGCGCGEDFTDPRDIEFDHRLPLHLGGTNDLDNFVALKKRHHLQKTKREAFERAKADRIRNNDLAHKKKLSAKDRELARMTGIGG